MDEMLDEEILNDFLTETNENLERLDQEFLDLETNPGESTLINSIFRTIHTIKGTSGFLGFSKLEGLAHITEDILSKCRDGKMTATPELISLLLNSVDNIKEIMANIGSSRGEGDKDISDLLEELNRVSKEGAVKAGTAAPAAQAEGAPQPVKAPETPEIKTPETPPQVAEAPAPPPLIIAVPVEPEPQVSQVQAPPPAAQQPMPAKPQGPTSQPQPGSNVQADTTIRVNIDLLDSLMNQVGELVLVRNQVLQNTANHEYQNLNAAAQKLNQVTTDLQLNIMKTRMQPIGNVFNKFPRVVRDLAKANNKLVRLEIEGQGTEVDKTLLEAIKDPLTHIVRNSVDHGIEPVAVRQQYNKPAEGMLLIQAFHESGQVVVEIRDDGGGINPGKIKDKAIEKGVVTAEVAEKMSDKELQMLIFHPGFSTAEKVTNISGRGVGMDVVRTNIEKIGGMIDISSEVGRGTTLKLRIPLTLAIIPALLVICSGVRYAIPQVNLLELVYLEGEEVEKSIENVYETEVFRLRGDLLPIIRLRNVFNLAEMERPENIEDDSLYIAVLQAGNQVFGLVVDDILDTEEIVVKPLTGELKKEAVYAGATILGDGQVSMILDGAGIMKKTKIDTDDLSGESKEGEDDFQEECQVLLAFGLNKEETLAIPLLLISRVEEITASQIKKVGGKEVISYFNSLIPLIRLEKYLDITEPDPTDNYSVIVFNFNEKRIGLMVNFIEDTVETKEQVDTSVFHAPGVLGTVVLNEKAILLVDIYKVIEMADPSFFERKQSAKLEKLPEEYRILLVEDSPFFLNLEKNYLESEKFTVETAMDGFEGLQALEKGEFDMIITDLEMPKMDGFTFVSEVRKMPSYNNMPIMAVTSLAGEKDRKKAMDAGVDDYRIKMDREELIEAARKMLTEGRP